MQGPQSFFFCNSWEGGPSSRWELEGHAGLENALESTDLIFPSAHEFRTDFWKKVGSKMALGLTWGVLGLPDVSNVSNRMSSHSFQMSCDAFGGSSPWSLIVRGLVWETGSKSPPPLSCSGLRAKSFLDQDVQGALPVNWRAPSPPPRRSHTLVSGSLACPHEAYRGGWGGHRHSALAPAGIGPDMTRS